jgi:hypothetical protein
MNATDPKSRPVSPLLPGAGLLILKERNEAFGLTGTAKKLTAELSPARIPDVNKPAKSISGAKAPVLPVVSHLIKGQRCGGAST